MCDKKAMLIFEAGSLLFLKNAQLCPKTFPSLSRRRSVVAIPGKVVRCQWGQFGMRASPYAPPNIDLLKTKCCQKSKHYRNLQNDSTMNNSLSFLYVFVY